MNATLPRSVWIAEDRTYWDIAADPQSVDLLADVDAMIVPYSAAPEVNTDAVIRVRELLERAAQWSVGTLLVKNPYDDDSYEPAVTAIETFTSVKYHALSNVARILGATSVSFVDVRVDQSASKWFAGINATVKIAAGEGDASREVKKKVEESLKGVMTFGGGDPDPKAALAYLSRRRLMGDHQLRSLVDMRTGNNPISSYEMVIDGVKESDGNFRSALKLANAGPVKAFDIGGSFSTAVSTLSRVEVRIKIAF